MYRSFQTHMMHILLKMQCRDTVSYITCTMDVYFLEQKTVILFCAEFASRILIFLMWHALVVHQICTKKYRYVGFFLLTSGSHTANDRVCLLIDVALMNPRSQQYVQSSCLSRLCHQLDEPAIWMGWRAALIWGTWCHKVVSQGVSQGCYFMCHKVAIRRVTRCVTR